MISLAKSEVAIKPDQLDRDRWLLNCRNGLLDLETGQLLPHDRKHLITKLIDVEYLPSATCDLWLKFLNEIMGGNQDLIGFIQRALGYSLTGDISERCIFILYGSGANGKTTLLSVLGEILNDYALQTPTQTLMTKHFEGIPNDVARLKGARFVTATESETNQRLNEGLIKQLAGGDMVSARFMRGEFFDFMPTHKLWLATNHKPVIRGTDKAIWDRIRLIPFNVAIPEEKQDKHLSKKLLSEASGILNWAIKGCLKWQSEGLGTPPEVKEATQAYREEMDILANWLGDSCLTGKQYSASAKSLYQSYLNWCEENGEKHISQRQFGLSLTERGFVKGRDTKGIIWQGIGIKGES
jgi:putative DNA primase/helicase